MYSTDVSIHMHTLNYHHQFQNTTVFMFSICLPHYCTIYTECKQNSRFIYHNFFWALCLVIVIQNSPYWSNAFVIVKKLNLRIMDGNIFTWILSFYRRLVERLENMKKNALGNGNTQCILCGDEFGLLGASPMTCHDCHKVCIRLKHELHLCRITLLH